MTQDARDGLGRRLEVAMANALRAHGAGDPAWQRFKLTLTHEQPAIPPPQNGMSSSESADGGSAG